MFRIVHYYENNIIGEWIDEGQSLPNKNVWYTPDFRLEHSPRSWEDLRYHYTGTVIDVNDTEVLDDYIVLTNGWYVEIDNSVWTYERIRSHVDEFNLELHNYWVKRTMERL